VVAYALLLRAYTMATPRTQHQQCAAESFRALLLLLLQEAVAGVQE
jgi:hypothetical protein